MVHTTCAMRNCKSSSRINKELKFHRFPREEDRCKLWVETCRTSGLLRRTCDSLKNSHICSLHFEKNMYKETLKGTAVPTLLLPPKESSCTQTDQMNTIFDFDSPDFKIAQKHHESAGPSSQSANYIGETAATDSSWHNGYRCSSCAELIVSKFRYACVQCPDFDLCGACEARGEHAAHYVLRIPPCRPFEEIDAVIQKIRGEMSLTSTNVLIELEVEPQQVEVDPLMTQAPDAGDLDALRKIKTKGSSAGSDERPSWSTDHILPDLPARKPAQVAYHEKPNTSTSKTQGRTHRPYAHTKMIDILIKQEAQNDFPPYLPRKPQADTSMASLPIKQETQVDASTYLPQTPQNDISITDVHIKQEIEIEIPLELNDPLTDNQVVPAVKRKRDSLKTLRLEAKLVGKSPNPSPMSDRSPLGEHRRAAKKKKV